MSRGLTRHETHDLPLVVQVGVRCDLLVVQGELLEGDDRIPRELRAVSRWM